MLTQEEILVVFEKWVNIFRLKNNWDVAIELVHDSAFWKTGDIKIDTDDRKAIVLLNVLNPKQENFEEVICHELLHLKLYPLDQLTEDLINTLWARISGVRYDICSVYDNVGADCWRINKVLSWHIRREQILILWEMQNDEII